MNSLEELKESLICRPDLYASIISGEHHKERREKWWERWDELIRAIESINKLIASENQHGGT